MASPGETSRVDRRRPILEQPDSPLLQLPGEIRNRIYEQSLTHSSSLWFVPGSYQRVRQDSKPEKAYFAIQPDRGYNIEKEFNQLKYVCRQMYDETHCLELKFNLIWFIGEPVQKRRRKRPAQAFAEFLEQCVPSKHCYISQVKLRLEIEEFDMNLYHPAAAEPQAKEIPLLMLESVTDFETIAAFCHKHPTSRVDYTVYHRNRDPYIYGFSLFDYLKQAVLMILALRHKNYLPLLSYSHLLDVAASQAQRWASLRLVQQLEVKNLRFFLAKEFEFSEFKEMIEEDGPQWDMTNTQIEGCIELYKDMERNGI